MFGSIGRPFPNWFTVVDPFVLPLGGPPGYVYPMRFSQALTSGQQQTGSQWHWEKTVTGVLLVLNLFTEFHTGPTMRIRLRAQCIGGPFARSADWALSLGFGVNPRSLAIEYLLSLVLDGGGWGAGGPPPEMTIKYGTYAAMPAGRCVP